MFKRSVKIHSEHMKPFKVFFFLYLSLLIVQLRRVTGNRERGGEVTRSKGTQAGSQTRVCCRASAHGTPAVPTELNEAFLTMFGIELRPTLGVTYEY